MAEPVVRAERLTKRYGPATVALFECLDGEIGVGATEALTWITTAEAVGAAVGAAAAGLLVTHAPDRRQEPA